MSFKTVLFYLVGLILLTAISAAEDQTKAADKKADGEDSEEIQIPGEYTIETDPDNEDYKKYMEAMGFAEDAQKLLREAKYVSVEIECVNETHWQVSPVIANMTWELMFESGKEFEAKLADGRPVNNTVTVNKEKKTIHRAVKMEGFEATHDAVFSKDGFNLTIKAKDAVATLGFTRELSLLESMKEWGDWLRKKIFGE